MVRDPAGDQGPGAAVALRSNLAPESETIVMPRGQLLRQVRDIRIQKTGFGGRLSPFGKNTRVEKAGDRFAIEAELTGNRATTEAGRMQAVHLGISPLAAGSTRLLASFARGKVRRFAGA
jgi:hypothetical protein